MLWVIKSNKACINCIDSICDEGSISQTDLDLLCPPAEDGGTGKSAKHGMWGICHHYKIVWWGICHHKMVCHNTIQHKILTPSGSFWSICVKTSLVVGPQVNAMKDCILWVDKYAVKKHPVSPQQGIQCSMGPWWGGRGGPQLPSLCNLNRIWFGRLQFPADIWVDSEKNSLGFCAE